MLLTFLAPARCFGKPLENCKELASNESVFDVAQLPLAQVGLKII
jgi:hypothetical protein